jgi:hypothetical protein
VGLLTLHMDDGILAGDRWSKVYQKAAKGIDYKFNSKGWADLEEGTVASYLGCSGSRTTRR